MNQKFETGRRKLARADPALGRIIRTVGVCGLEYRGSFNPFQELLRSIVYQQLSGKAAAAIHRRVRALFPGQRASVRRLYEIPDEGLRGAGLSGAKVLALRSLAEHARAGGIPSRRAMDTMSDEAIIERLVAVRGIGQWTVEMMLIYQLGRPDVLPATDLGIRKGFAYMAGQQDLPAPKALLAYGERWRPYRSIASWYLWRASEL